MSAIFITLYNYFKRRKIVLFLGVLSLLAVASTQILQLKFEDDISKVIPLDKRMKKMNDAYQNAKFSEKIIFHFYLKDRTQEEDVDQLITAADSCVYLLETAFDSSYIKGIRYAVPENAILGIYEELYANLPFYLEEEDYANLEQRLTPEGIDKSLKGVYKNLISPSSLVIKKNLLKDPLALTTLPLRKFQQHQVGGNYTLYKGRIMTENQKHLLFFVDLGTNANATNQNEAFFIQLEQTLAELGTAFPNIKLEYFSGAAVAVANARQVQNDINYTVGLALMGLILFISFFFRRPSAFFLIFIPVIFGASMGLMALVLFRPAISPISLGMGAMLLGISVDFSLHIFTHFQSVGDSRKTLKDIATPIFVSSLTTSSAFFCLLWVSSDALKDLGLFAGVSVFSAAIIALILLPHFLRNKKTDSVKQQQSWLGRLVAYPLHRNKFAIWGVIIFSIICLFFYQRVGFESDLMKINFMPKHLAEAEQNLQKISASLSSTFLVAKGRDLNEALHQTEQARVLLDSFAQKGMIQSYSSASQFIRSTQEQEVYLEHWKAFWTRERKDSLRRRMVELGKEYKLKEKAFQPFYDLLEKDFKTTSPEQFTKLNELFLSEFLSQTDSSTTLFSVIKVSPNAEDRNQVYEALAAEEGAVFLDRRLLTKELISTLSTDFNRLVSWSLLVVLLILILAFGRIELGLLTFFPVLLSWFWTLGVMGMLGINFTIIDIIVSTFIFGLGIDYSIFITNAMLQRYIYGEDVLDSYKMSIFLSALTTICGIGVLVFAKHPALYSVALLAIIGIVAVLLIPYIIQPILFNFFIIKRSRKGLLPHTLLTLLTALMMYVYLGVMYLLFNLLGGILTVIPMPFRYKKVIFHSLFNLFAKSVLGLMFYVQKKRINFDKKDFGQPHIILSNYQSFIDTLCILSLSPKIALITDDKLWNSPFMMLIAKYADVYSSRLSINTVCNQLDASKQRDYSIAISSKMSDHYNNELGEFKRAVDLAATQFSLPIQIILLHGTQVFKNGFLPYTPSITLQCIEEIAFLEEHDSKRIVEINARYQEAYVKLCKTMETPAFFYHRLVHNYTYKGLILPWYSRIKLSLEGNYEVFNNLIPQKASILDIGCGYGLMAYMLSALSKERDILGIDYDQEKIKLARNCYTKTARVNFKQANASTYSIPKKDVYLISDMLHYLPEIDQEKLIRQCIEQLNPNGMLIIREGDCDLEKRHKGTEKTEWWSTQIIGFNKMEHPLTYLSGKRLESIAAAYNLEVERIDVTKKTSNIIFVIRKN
ncbi:MAG: methyltransferase domain-containing protein [Saprospiraceae bacterium]|nr:methyltransferase domain-containing protein [Saprospiraceae bacterium]